VSAALTVSPATPASPRTSVSTSPAGRAGPAVGDKGLRGGALGLLATVVIGVSSTAPAYGMAATLGLLVAVVGLHAPGVLVVSFLPMLFIAYAFRELNRVDPDCGTTFAWATRAFGPSTGWMGGWGIVAADVIVMSSLGEIAGRYFFLVIGADGLAQRPLAVTAVGVAFIAVLTWVCYRGVEVSARLQAALLAVELGALLLLVSVALVKVYTGHALVGATHPSLSWLNPFPGSAGALSNGFLLAVFIYWGWDCALSVNEETKDSARTPGRAGVISVVVLVAVFAVISIAALAFAGPAYLASHSDDVLGAISSAVLGSTAGKLLLLCVLTSAAASAQTTILPTARATLSMAAHGALPAGLARVNPRFRTPAVSTVAMGVVSALFFVVLSSVSANVLGDSAAAVGLLIAFYYGLTGFACVWYFRRRLTTSARALWFQGIFPLVGALVLLWAFAVSVRSYLPADSSATSLLGMGGIFVIGAGALALGVPVMLLVRWRAPGFFRRHPVSAPPDPAC
jgi:amino acid transporter